MKKNFFLTTLLIFIYLGIHSITASAQVNIAPVAIYMNDNQRTGRIVVRNSSNEPQEITVKLIFGYPTSDKEGNVFLKKFDTVPDGAPSAREWVRVYPRHLVLPPQQQQTIRFSARPPANLPSAEYWVRPAILSSKKVQLDANSEKDISANLNMIKRTFLSLNYRHGKVQTGLAITDIIASTSGEKLRLMADLKHKGNAAYLGEASLLVFDSSDKLRQEISKEIAVYQSEKRKFEMDINGFSPGTYRAELSFDTQKRAENNEAVLPAPQVSKSVKFTVQ